MHVGSAGYELLSDISYGAEFELMDIERAARTCYRSEGLITEQAESAKKLISRLIASGHEAMLEHSSLSVLFTCDRAIANELCRHRMASFAQESTRWCNYNADKFGSEITCIPPSEFEPGTLAYNSWQSACEVAEKVYMSLVKSGVAKAQNARAVLPLSLATKIVVTANYREWRHILKLRTAKDAHPDMRALMIPLLKDLKEQIPVVFDDIEVEE